ncbi:MAG: hypothetical protein WEB87_05375, partial [Bacteriovoracaceae bacterium]
LGFIRTLSGTFMNTRFVTPRVTGKDITGLVGQSWTSAVIYNIQVQDGRVVGSKDAIYGNAFVGGIAGHFEGNKILDVTVENTLVKAIDGDYVGGLIGMAQSGEFANLSFHGEVDAFDGLSGSDYAGGLAGYLGTGVSLHGGVAQGNLKADIGLNHGEDFGYSLDAATDDITTNMTINGL